MWERKGLIYTCDFYGTGYAQDAFIDPLNERIWRIYYSARERKGEGYVSYAHYIDVEAGKIENIVNIPKKPIIVPGVAGTFDDNGVTMCSIVQIDEHKKYLYYCGWNRKHTVSYSLSIGVCEVIDNEVYRKLSDGPILERNIFDVCSVSAPMVIRENGVFHLWYISFPRWEEYNGKLEPIYVIKHAVSKDGLQWECNGQVCIDQSYPGEALGRPWVIKDDNLYRMWFSTRGIQNYRDKNGQHYTIGYAESTDGINWERRPENFDFQPSKEGWDSEMQEYASVKKYGDDYYMIYNGNEFGKTGFGYAIGRFK